MRLTNAGYALAAVLLALLLTGQTASALPFSFCGRHTVTFLPLAPTLNNVYQCNRAICAGQAVQFETKKIATYADIPQWLTGTTDVSTQYTAAQQDTIVQSAKNLAVANRPPLKSVYNIQFFYDVDVPNNVTTYVIGADITYARCVKGGSAS